MPTYEYKCETSGKVFEIRQGINAQPLTNCIIEGCTCNGHGKVHRLVSKNIGLIFNGNGFYQTDYVNVNNNENINHSAGCSCCNKANTCPAANE